MEASFVGDKQVDPRNLPESSTRNIPDEELDKDAQRLKANTSEPGANKIAGAASRDPKDYDTSKRGGQGNCRYCTILSPVLNQRQMQSRRPFYLNYDVTVYSNVPLRKHKYFFSVSLDMLLELPNATGKFTRQLISMRSRSLTLYRASKLGKRVQGEMNLKRYFEHYDLLSTTPSSTTSEFNPKRELKFPVDPKSNPDNCAPFEELSGDFNRSGMRSTEYFCVDKGREPYSHKGGEHRYGGTGRYEWSAERLETGSKENKKSD